MESVDVLIVGGGIAGASLGARLAGGRRAMLIESEDLCGRHATGRSAAFWQASLGGDTPERRLSLASKPMFDMNWPGSPTALLRPRGGIHLTGPSGEMFDEADAMAGEYRIEHLDRAELDAMLPGLRQQWTGAWYEATCADIDVAAFHAACLAAFRRQGGRVHTDAGLQSARRSDGRWIVETGSGQVEAGIIVNAAGAWGDDVAARCGVRALGLQPKRRTVVQLRIGRTGLRDLPFVTDLHASFYFKGEGDNSVWVCPLDETDTDPCDAAPEELAVAQAIDRFERVVDWRVEAVERKWAGLRSFAPDRLPVYGFDPRCEGLFWFAGQGGFGIQTAPAAARLAAQLLLGLPRDAMTADLDAALYAPARFG